MPNLKTEVTRKLIMPNFPKNEHFLPLDRYTYVCVSGGKKCSFFGKFGVLCFLITSVLRFAILQYYRRILLFKNMTQLFTFASSLFSAYLSATLFNNEPLHSFAVFWNLLINLSMSAFYNNIDCNDYNYFLLKRKCIWNY